MTKAIRVLVVDDSPFVCQLLSAYLAAAPDLCVIGTASNGARAVELVKHLRPDVVTLDLEMPDISGLETLEQIMHECPTPVVLVSGTGRRAAALTLQGVHLGAIDFVLKYTPGVDTDPEVLQRGLLTKIRAAARIHVIRSLPGRRASARPGVAPLPLWRPSLVQPTPTTGPRHAPVDRVIVLGASTGGPTALRELLSVLPPDFSATILVVQHIPAAFTAVLVAQLQRAVPLLIREAQEGDVLRPGTVLVAPGGTHLLVGMDARIHLTDGPEVGGHRPSIDVTMQSVAQVYGARAQGVVLTGMGADGAMGLLAIHARGGTTFAQDTASCVVDGMPQRAIATGVVDYVDTPTGLAQRLLQARPQWSQR
ncbi:MAG: chemotaxis-specific protein-glutamate methyltransferase CheB [Candidatus Tectomicrobia bacterium]|uniref:Protein-glutamate methylesterase/protein-glutamine glutaminase n=1 Tax=Tectimicrobiota bacterium TaxID=2528274 RepID=A0A937W336_UNCTE|nr:chemotaxis-specific protein-glutamate methyltransferase CheB [Candidatus Tectomicrobia bacterium]